MSHNFCGKPNKDPVTDNAIAEQKEAFGGLLKMLYGNISYS